MDKRTIIVLVLTMAMLFVFQTYFMPKETPQQQKPQTQAQPVPPSNTAKPAGEAAQKAPDTQTTPASSAEKKATKTIAVSTPYLDVSLTDLGGGISSVKLKKYKATVKGPEEKEIIENVAPYSYNPTVYLNGSQDRVYFRADKQKLTVTDASGAVVM